jgi:modulator of FtsH protease HflK
MSELPDKAVGPAAVPAAPPPPPPPGPIAQSVAIGFRTVYAVALLLVAVWLSSNVREIAPDRQAVVRRFGRIVRSQQAGLLLAWPRPIESVQLLPGPDRQLSVDVEALEPPTTASQELIRPTGASESLPQNVAAFMTGDSNIVLLNATLIYRISDPLAYALEQDHVAAALNRLFRTTSVHVTAGRNLNDFLVVQSATSGSEATVALRAEIRDSLLSTMNARLQALAGEGASLGVEVERIDITAWLPPEAKTAFDAVLVATQAAERGIAVARTDAERRRQQATQESNLLQSTAQAVAKERISNAEVNTAGILALEREEAPETRNSLLLRQYRTDIGNILDRTGSLTLVDPKGGIRFVLPGKEK